MASKSFLSRKEMEERRLKGGRLLKAGKLSQAEIARQLGVSRASVSDWAKEIEEKGVSGLQKKKAPGSIPKLSRDQQQELKRFLDRGARACGFPTDRWTLKRIHHLIKQKFKIDYHANYLNRLLIRLGYSPEKPLPRGILKHESDLIQAWSEGVFPAIKRTDPAWRKDDGGK